MAEDDELTEAPATSAAGVADVYGHERTKLALACRRLGVSEPRTAISGDEVRAMIRALVACVDALSQKVPGNLVIPDDEPAGEA